MWIHTHTHTRNPIRLGVMLTWAVVRCACVCTWMTAGTVKGCGVSRGLVMNGSVVTSQVQLPLCCLYAACSPIIPQALHVWCTERQCGRALLLMWIE